MRFGLLIKGRRRAHTRRVKSGKVVQVREATTKVEKRQKLTGLGRGKGSGAYYINDPYETSEDLYWLMERKLGKDVLLDMFGVVSTLGRKDIERSWENAKKKKRRLLTDEKIKYYHGKSPNKITLGEIRDELENWNRHKMTYVLSEYIKTGKVVDALPEYYGVYGG